MDPSASPLPSPRARSSVLSALALGLASAALVASAHGLLAASSWRSSLPKVDERPPASAAIKGAARPAALVFRPSQAGQLTLAQHRSHSSHASHASHASHYSGSSPAPSRPRTPALPLPSPAPAPTVAPKTPAPLLVPTKPSKSIYATLEEFGKCDLFLTAIKHADLQEVLKGSDSYTVFAPTDDAIRAMPSAVLTELLKGKDKKIITAFVKQHIVKSSYDTKSVKGQSAVTAESGQRLSLTTRESKIRVEAATVVDADKTASNGVLHIVDRVIPAYDKDLAGVLAAEGFSTFAKLVAKSELKDILSKDWQVTCVAPTDEALSTLPAGAVDRMLSDSGTTELAAFVKRHLYMGRVFTNGLEAKKTLKAVDGHDIKIGRDGETVNLDDAKVSKPDIGAKNGVIQGIDRPLLSVSK